VPTNDSGHLIHPAPGFRDDLEPVDHLQPQHFGTICFNPAGQSQGRRARPLSGPRRGLPSKNLLLLRDLTTGKAQVVDMRKRLSAQTAARRKQDVPADLESMDADLRAMLDTQSVDLERRMESVIAKKETLAAKARLLRSIPGIGPISAAMLIAATPELGRMTSGEAAAMTGLAPVSYDRGAMRGRRAIVGGRRSLRQGCSKQDLPPPDTIQF
jgi:transposase